MRKTVASYLRVVLWIAVPISLFEIWLCPFTIGRFGGFCFVRLNVPMLKSLVGDCMVTPYHLTLFLVIVPVFCGIGTWIVGKDLIHGGIAKFAFFGACQLGVMVGEDASWFILNTVFRLRLPDALPRLLHGDIPWFPHWIDFGAFKLPDFYLYLPFAIIILLAIETIASRKATLVRPPTHS
ncbi:MAG TPA: hypothetical protein VIJ29_00195 [Candidatus Paceibacterota bacterium]